MMRIKLFTLNVVNIMLALVVVLFPHLTVDNPTIKTDLQKRFLLGLFYITTNIVVLTTEGLKK